MNDNGHGTQVVIYPTTQIMETSTGLRIFSSFQMCMVYLAKEFSNGLMISSPARSYKMQWIPYSIRNQDQWRYTVVEGDTLSCGPVTGHTRLLMYEKRRREKMHIAPAKTSLFPRPDCIPNQLIGGAGEELIVATMYNRWQLCQ